MIQIEKYDFDKEYNFKPIIDEFVTSHKSLLSFNSNYPTIFIDYLKEMEGNSLKVIYIAKESFNIAGLIVGTIEDNPSLLLPKKFGYIPIIVVLPEFRRKGIAKGLFLTLKKWFKTSGISQIELYTQIDNEFAKPFWQSCGFEVYLERRKIII